MPYYILYTRVTTWQKSLVEAADADEALEQEGEYLGSVEVDSRPEVEVSKPFATRARALHSVEAWTQEPTKRSNTPGASPPASSETAEEGAECPYDARCVVYRVW